MQLSDKAKKIRKTVLEMIYLAGKGHIGGAFSCTDIMVALYYGNVLRLDHSKKDWPGRDRFILSKGHSCAALYAILADLGYFKDSELENYQKEGSILRGHPDRRIPGIEADTGSLGHGLGIGAGLALSAKLNKKDFRTFVLLGDGECYEGSIWEALMFASHHRLNNLIAIVDNNGLCSTGIIKDSLCMEPLCEKWKAFGWDVVKVDGHSFKDLLQVFSSLSNRDSCKPLVMIADTVKGKGISFMENSPLWHHGVPKGQMLETARKELKKND